MRIVNKKVLAMLLVITISMQGTGWGSVPIVQAMEITEGQAKEQWEAGELTEGPWQPEELKNKGAEMETQGDHRGKTEEPGQKTISSKTISSKTEETGEGTADGENPEAEPIENYSLEEMEGELSGFYDGCNLRSDSIYATKTLLVESDADTFDTFGANSIIYFGGIYALSYTTISQTEKAYGELSALGTVSRVEVDAVLETGTAGLLADENQRESERKPSELKQYLESRNPVQETIVAIIDTGYTKEGTTERIVDLGYNVSTSGIEGSMEDDSGHGTQMGNIILNNTPECVKIMPLKAANDQGNATVMSTCLAIQKAVEQEAETILISMNAKASASSKILEDAIREAVERGIQVVVSAGNGSVDVKDITPSNIEGTIVVSAVNSDGSFAGYSNYGKTVAYCSFGTYQGSQGTSYAAAYVCAAVAYGNAIGEDSEEVFRLYLANPFGPDASYYGKGLIAFTVPAVIGKGEGRGSNKTDKDRGRLQEEESKETEVQDRAASDELRISDTSANITVYSPETGSNGEGYYYLNITKGETARKYTVKFKIGTTAYTGTPRSFPYFGSDTNMFDNDLAMTYSYGNNNLIRAELSGRSISQSGSNTFSLGTDGTWFTFNDYYVGTTALGGGPTGNWRVQDRQYNLYMPLKVNTYTGYKLTKSSAGDCQWMISGIDTATGSFLVKMNTNNSGLTDFDHPGIWKHITLNLAYEPREITFNYKKGSSDTTGIINSNSTKYDSKLSALRKGSNFKGRSYSIEFNVNGGNAVSNISGNLSPAANFWKIGADAYIKEGEVSASKVNSYYSAYGTTVDVTAQWEAKTVILPIPARTGYTFNGWYEDSGFSGSAKTSYTINPATSAFSKNLYAKWTINSSTLKVNPNEGTWNGKMDIQEFTKNYGETKDIPIPARTGYKFKTWEKSTAFYGKMSTLTMAAVYTYGSAHNVDSTIKALWAPIEYTIKYDRNDGAGIMEIGSGSMDNVKHTYNEAKNLSKNKFERTYYKFAGWKDANGKTYRDGEEIKNLTSTDGSTIILYAQWEKKRFHVGYSGNSQTDGVNMVENNIWHGDPYIFRDNVFGKEETEVRVTESGTEYEVRQKYGFQGWEFDVGGPEPRPMYASGILIDALQFYDEAMSVGAITSTLSDSSPYEEVQPLKTALARNAIIPISAGIPAEEYINLRAVWDAFPTIDKEPQDDIDEDEKPRIEDNTLFFYEGELPTKENLIAHLVVLDKEDGDLKSQLKIKKIVYRDGLLKAGDTKEWENDIPDDYVFDTYYLAMEKDEVLTHIVTYEVTDSAGNTTTKDLPVKVKYNNYPEIAVPEVYYYFKEDANRGMITEEELLSNGGASDIEDKDKIKDKLELVGFEPQIFKMQTESQAEFEVNYKVTDAFQKTTLRGVKIIVADPDALLAETPIPYVRFISYKYLDTLEPTSIWRESGNYSYLQEVLNNEIVNDTWYFTHENVVKIKDWILEDGEGYWKRGQAANQEFLDRFSGCRQ